MLYGRRQGRALREGKKTLLDELLPTIHLTVNDGALICEAPLTGYKEVWLEIGFGNGDHLAALAEKYPDILMIGCEPFINGVGTFLSTIDEKKLSNVRIFTEAAQILLEAVPSEYFSRSFLLFPDPWPKKRHHKRRFVVPSNLSILGRALKPQAELLFATDHADYREWALEVFEKTQDFEIVSQGLEAPAQWVKTRFQKKGIKEGRPAYFVRLRKP